MENRIEKITTDGFCMKYFKFGGGPRTLVILPGLSVQSVLLSAAAVEAEYAIFKDDFTVCLFDRREDIPKNYSVYDMAIDTARAVKAAGLHDIYLSGASQGGMMAMYIAICFPDLVKKLAVCSTALSVTGERGKAISEWIDFAKRGDAGGLYTDFAKKVYPRSVFEKYGKALKIAAGAVTPQELDRFVILAEGTKNFDITDRTGEIRCPVLAAGSEDDEVLGAGAIREIIEKLSDKAGSESIVYNGYGHAAYDTAPDFRERLYSFFIEDLPSP